MSKRFLNRSNLVSIDGSLDLLRKSISESVSFDAYGEQDIFPAMVLVPPKLLTVTEASSYGTATKADLGQQAKIYTYITKVRIISDNSPHQYLPDPTNPAFNVLSVTDDESATPTLDALTIVNLHTTVVIRTAGNLGIAMGDIIDIRLKRDGTEGALNMQTGEYVGTAGGAGQGGTNFTRSTGALLGSNFDYLEGAATGGAKDDPTFSKCRPSIYPGLEKKPTRFISYGSDRVLDSLSSLGIEGDQLAIMWAFMNMEQPGFSFPANNVAGIQLDNRRPFTGAQKSDFDYQTCFRDNGGDQRIFAGFDNLERGMAAFAKIIKGKMSSFKKLPGTGIADDAEALTWNYYRNWNTQFSKQELIELKASGRVVRDGEVIERSWSTTSNVFHNALQQISDYELAESSTADDDLYGESEV